MRIAFLFFKRNFKKFTGIILSLLSFLLVMNLILGIILSVNDNFKRGIVNNSDLYFMEVYNEDAPMDISLKLRDKVNSIEGVESSFFDFSHPVKLYDKGKNNIDMTNILGVETKTLQYFNVDDIDVEEDFIFINRSLSDKKEFKDLKKGDKVYIKDYKYVKQGDSWEGEEYFLERTFYGFLDFDENNIFRNNISLIEYNSAEKIARGMTRTGDPYFSRFIVIVPEVDKLEEVANVIREEDKDLKVRYTLDETGSLPSFAVIIVAVSALIIAILFLISVFSVLSNLNQILELRKRDFALFDMFGVDGKEIMKMFIVELFIHGILTFISTVVITYVSFYLFRSFLQFDLLTEYLYIYILVDFILAVGMLVFIGIIKLKKTLKANDTMGFYKEVLKQ